MIELDDVAVGLAQTLKTLVVEKTALIAANAGAEEVAHKELAIETVREAQALILRRASQEREEKERAKKHAAAYGQACQLKEKFEAASHVLERATVEYLTAEKNVDLIEQAIAEHSAHEPRPENFPSTKQTRQWKLRLQHLEQACEERKATLRKANQNRRDAHEVCSKLKAEFDLAAFQSRYYAPRQAGPKPVPVAWAIPSSPASRTTNSPV